MAFHQPPRIPRRQRQPQPIIKGRNSELKRADHAFTPLQIHAGLPLQRRSKARPEQGKFGI